MMDNDMILFYLICGGFFISVSFLVLLLIWTIERPLRKRGAAYRYHAPCVRQDTLGSTIRDQLRGR